MIKKIQKTDGEQPQKKLQLQALLKDPEVLEEICGEYRRVTLEIEFDEVTQEFFYELCVEGNPEITNRVISRDGLNITLRIKGGFVRPPPIEKEK